MILQEEISADGCEGNQGIDTQQKIFPVESSPGPGLNPDQRIQCRPVAVSVHGKAIAGCQNIEKQDCNAGLDKPGMKISHGNQDDFGPGPQQETTGQIPAVKGLEQIQSLAKAIAGHTWNDY